MARTAPEKSTFFVRSNFAVGAEAPRERAAVEKHSLTAATQDLLSLAEQAIGRIEQGAQADGGLRELSASLRQLRELCARDREVRSESAASSREKSSSAEASRSFHSDDGGRAEVGRAADGCFGRVGPPRRGRPAPPLRIDALESLFHVMNRPVV